jgi:hypothetical protein
MAFNYLPSDKERKAAKLLRDRGWYVSEPECPKCKGWGTVGRVIEGNSDRTATHTYSVEPCPNGCPSPMLYY